jgi:glucokinase
MNVLAVDLGGSHVTCALLCGTVSGARVLKRESMNVSNGASFGTVLPEIEASLRRLLEEARPNVECRGIGFGFCGLVDPRRSRILSTNGKYDDACDIDLNEWALGAFGLPLRLENDARLALLGERMAGAARGFDDIVMITLGTGVGGAAMIGGELLHGKHFQAGCLGGHFVVNCRGRRCTCGNIGCIEAEASSWSLPLICREHPQFASSALAALPEVTFEALFQLAATDRCAMEIRDACIDTWAAGCVTMIHAYDPEVLIVGGGLMKSADQILPRLQTHIEKYAWTPWGTVKVRAAELSDSASLIGAIPLFERGSR